MVLQEHNEVSDVAHDPKFLLIPVVLDWKWELCPSIDDLVQSLLHRKFSTGCAAHFVHKLFEFEDMVCCEPEERDCAGVHANGFEDL